MSSFRFLAHSWFLDSFGFVICVVRCVCPLSCLYSRVSFRCVSKIRLMVFGCFCVCWVFVCSVYGRFAWVFVF